MDGNKDNKELWKPIRGFQGKYEVSNYGKIRSLNYKNMGYIEEVKVKLNEERNLLYVILYISHKSFKKYVTNIVYEAFLEVNIPKEYIAENIDCNPWNMSLDNLSIVTCKEHHRRATEWKKKVE